MYGRADQPADAPASTPAVTDPPRSRHTGELVRRPTPPRLRPGLADRTDASLLRAAREGDARAYEAIVARYREPLRRACARITADRAEDAVQHALLSAWVALERGADVRELRPWLYSIARNAAIDQARGIRSEHVELGPEVPGGEDPAHAEARRREVTEVLEAVAALPERQRRALVDTALHGRATEAVAGDLGLSGGALRQLVHRARTSVRAAVPSIAFPVPPWLADLLGEEGLRRGAVLLSSGSGAALLAKTTATVATIGAVVAGGVSVDRAAERASTGTQAASVVRAAPRAGSDAAGAGVLVPTATLVPVAARGHERALPATPSDLQDPQREGREAGDDGAHDPRDRGGSGGPTTYGASDGSPGRDDADDDRHDRRRGWAAAVRDEHERDDDHRQRTRDDGDDRPASASGDHDRDDTRDRDRSEAPASETPDTSGSAESGGAGDAPDRYDDPHDGASSGSGSGPGPSAAGDERTTSGDANAADQER